MRRRRHRGTDPAGSHRILVVSEIFAPEMGALANRLTPICRRLVREGHSVAVATKMPNYPEGRIFPGYAGRRAVREDVDGVSVFRTRSYISPRNVSAWRQLRSHLAFIPAALRGGLRAGRVDVVLVTSPQLFAVIPAIVLARVRGARLILDLRDLWPDEIVACGAAAEGSTPIRAMRLIERWAYRNADRVTCTTKAFVDTVRARGVEPERTVFLPNGADLEVFRPLPRDNPVADAMGLGDRFVVAYSGVLGIKHGLEAVVDAAGHLRDHEDVVFLLIGQGARSDALRESVARRGLTNVVFAGQRPIDELPHLLARADACLATLLPDPYLEKIISVKMFEYMACGKPVIGALRGEGARVLTEAGGGLVVPPGDGRAIADAVLRLRDAPEAARAMGESGRQHVEENYSRDVTAGRLEAVVRELAAGR